MTYPFENHLNKEIWGTVLVCQICDSTKTLSIKSNREAAQWLNHFYDQITELTLSHGGIPIKYMGGGYIGFFAGADSENRGIKTSLKAHREIDEGLSIGLHCGEVLYCKMGHKDYAVRDILGTTVNQAFRIEALKSATGTKASMDMVRRAEFENSRNVETVYLKGLTGAIEVCDIF